MPPWEKYQAGPWSKYKKEEAPIGAYINKGLTAPLDLATQGMNLAMRGGGEAARALGAEGDVPQFSMPSEAITNILGRAGIPVATGEPTTLRGNVERVIGETVGFGGLAAGGAAALGTSIPVTTGSAALELGAAAGAGAAGYGAKEAFPDSPTAEVLGELAGGLGVAGAPLIAKVAREASLGGTAYRAARGAITPFTETGGKIRAERRVKDLARDPEAAAANIRAGTEGELSPSTASGEPGLMALEEEVLKTDMKLEGEFNAKTQESLQRLRDGIMAPGAGGDIAATKGVIGDRRAGVQEALEGAKQGRLGDIASKQEAAQKALEAQTDRSLRALDARLQQASALAEQRLSAIKPSMREQAASRIVRDEVEAALASARAQETALWKSVPEDVVVSTENSRAAYQELWDDLSTAQRDQMPAKAREYLGGNGRLGDENTIKELQGLRSELLEEARVARSEKRYNKARLAEGVADGILDDMASAAGPEIDAAREFSAVLNQKFKQGAIGKVLSTSREGGPRVPPEMTLDALVKKGTPGDLAISKLSRAIEEDPEAGIEAVQEYLKSRFVASASANGKLNAAQARKFVSEYGDALDRFPALKRQMGDTAEAQAILDDVGREVATGTKQAGVVARQQSREIDQLTRKASAVIERKYADRIKRLQNPSISYTAQFLNAPVDREIATIIRSRNPGAAARELRKMAAKDPTGQASRGLKAGVVDHVINKAASGSFAPDGTNILSGNALRGALADKPTRSVLNAVLTPQEVTRMDRLANELQRMEARRGKLPSLKGVMDDTPSKILDLMVRTIAARHGAAVGGSTSGASLVTAGFFSQRARNWLGRITNDKAAEIIKDAVKDPELMRALLLDVTKAPERRKREAFTRLNAWLAGPGNRVVEETEGDDDVQR